MTKWVYLFTEGNQNMRDWRLIAMFFAGDALAPWANKFERYGMNRLCTCWAQAPWKARGPMIILFNHKGRPVKKITSAQYKMEKLAREMQVLIDLAEKDRQSGRGAQESGD